MDGGSATRPIYIGISAYRLFQVGVVCFEQVAFFNWKMPAKYDDGLGSDISQEVMMELVWTEKLSVGNAIIDSEHRNLIIMINVVSLGIKIRDGSALSQAFKLLEHWLRTHFANEEKIAQAVNFPFAQHKLAQQHSLKELQYMRDELEAKDGLWSDSAVEHFTCSLKNWMVDGHIVNLDMRMKPALQNYDYNFWPGRKDGDVVHIARAANPYLKHEIV